MKALHKVKILTLIDKHTFELEELRKKQRREIKDLLANLEITK